MRETFAAVLLILAFLAFVGAVLAFAEWLIVRVEAWALARGWMKEEEREVE